MVLFLLCRQSEHASNLRELAHKQLRCHANAPTTEEDRAGIVSIVFRAGELQKGASLWKYAT